MHNQFIENETWTSFDEAEDLLSLEGSFSFNYCWINTCLYLSIFRYILKLVGRLGAVCVQQPSSCGFKSDSSNSFLDEFNALLNTSNSAKTYLVAE